MAARPALLNILGRLRIAFGTLLRTVFGWLRTVFGWLRIVFGWLLAFFGKLLVALDKWLVFIAALLALAAGVWLLVIVWHGRPVAADFTRVGGATRVETAVGASRSWITPPQYAMLHDAPLLFTSEDKKRNGLVSATVERWTAAEPKGSDLPKISTVGNHHDSKTCGHLIGVSGLSTLEMSIQLLRLPRQVAVQDTLAPVAVFAAPKGPHDSPDVAVGLALAAHLARAAHASTTDPEVSLVVVPPRYLDSDPQLEEQLRDQGGPVQGGVVLGSTHILSEDTRALLRQILTATDKQGVLGEIRTNLGMVGPLIAALLALLGLGTAAAVAPEIGQKVVKYVKERESSPGRKPEMNGNGKRKGQVPDGGGTTAEQAPAVESDWLPALGDAQKDGRLVTVWLRTGRRVTGKVDRDHCTARVLRLDDARRLEPEPEYEADFLLVLFEEIESIGANVHQY
jgi:hypothetical protein